MANQVTAPRGTKDILPTETGRWQYVEGVAREACRRFRYAEIRTPIFESTDLFQRGIGETTDIVGKEMYTFMDKGERSLTLRPENTAGVVRAYVEHKLFTQPAPQKFWYLGPMFRYERPAAGRQRQFHQLGVECLGSEDPRWDAETILLATELLDQLGIPGLTVELNSVGCDTCRPAYRDALQAYLRGNLETLCADCHVRTEKNPLRALDCKVPGCQPVKAGAPPLSASLCDVCTTHQAAVEGYLAVAGQAFKLNENLVRGLDYYTRTVFEITTTHEKLGNQNTVCAGGRYNKLVEELGGPATPAVGWGLGLERLMILLPEEAGQAQAVQAVLVATAGEPERRAFQLAMQLRRQGLVVELANAGKLDKQFKHAERLGARFAVVLGEDEVAKGTAQVKDLQTREQRTVALGEVKDALLGAVAGGK